MKFLVIGIRYDSILWQHTFEANDEKDLEKLIEDAYEADLLERHTHYYSFEQKDFDELPIKAIQKASFVY